MAAKKKTTTKTTTTTTTTQTKTKTTTPTFDAKGACVFPLEQLCEENPALARAYDTLAERERFACAASGIEYDPDEIGCVIITDSIEGGKPGTDLDLDFDGFYVFVVRLLDACCGGSTGGDAHRASSVLGAAMVDIMAAKMNLEVSKYFDKLFALTLAILETDVRDVYLDRGFEPDTFFEWLASGWRGLLEDEGRAALRAAKVPDDKFEDAVGWLKPLKEYLESGEAGGVSIFAQRLKFKFDYEPRKGAGKCAPAKRKR